MEDSNVLLWKQIRAVSPTVLPTPVEKCAPWRAGRVYVTFDLVCTRLQVYTCVEKRGCSYFDPRFDDEETYWKKRSSTPALINPMTQPTIDCIDFDSRRDKLDLSDSTDKPFFGVKQDEAWFDEVREDDPFNKGQILFQTASITDAAPY